MPNKRKKSQDRFEYNRRKEIDHRIERASKIDRLSEEWKNKSMTRAREILNLSIAENKSLERISSLEQAKARINEDIAEAKERLEVIRRMHRELGDEHEVVITEHAFLRYAERYLGLDIEKLYKDIQKLPKQDIQRFGNTIVTVYPMEEPSMVKETAKDMKSRTVTQEILTDPEAYFTSHNLIDIP